MRRITRIRTIIAATGLLGALVGVGASAEEALPRSASLDGLGDPVCEGEARDLGHWLYSMAASPDDQMSAEPLDQQLLDPAIQPLAGRIAGECSPAGWALARVGAATGRDKVLWLAEYLPAAVEQCGCDLDLTALRYLLWQVCATPADGERDEDAGESSLADRGDREERPLRDLVQPETERRMDQGRRGRARWNPRRGSHGSGEAQRLP